MNNKSKEKLRHASSRRVLLKGNTVIKFYPTFYGYVIHDIVYNIFSVFHGISGNFFIPSKRKILNEVRGRKILKAIGVNATKIKRFSLDKKYVEERFYSNASSLDDIEKNDPIKAEKLAMKIGEITRRLNDKNYYFIDNRASNWMANKNLIRTDLELFCSKNDHKRFFRYCDVLSFTSSIKRQEVKERFIYGYNKKGKIIFSTSMQFFAGFYIKITDLIF